MEDIENVLIFFQEGNQLNIQSIDTPDEGQPQVVKAHEQMIRDAEASDDASTEEEQNQNPEPSEEPLSVLKI